MRKLCRRADWTHLAGLREEGLKDNTVVILWSDHGYKLGEYRGWGKMTNYEIDTRVPLIVSAPGMQATAGQSTQSFAELLDIYPTLCELLNVETPKFVEGKSLVPVLQDSEAAVHEVAVSQYYRKHEGSEYMGYALRTDEYRFVEWRDFETGEVVDCELYDHRGTPTSSLGVMETLNLAPSADSDLLETMSQKLHRTHPPKALSLTPSVHTNPSGLIRLKVSCTIENGYPGEISVYNIKPSGARAKGRKLMPGASITYNARIGGVFVIESKDGLLHQIHSPSWPEKKIVITQAD